MFIGEYQHSIDTKGRMIIPAKFREELQSNFIVTRGLDGCLTIYTIEQWAEIIAGLKKLPNTKKETRMYIHMLTAKATECTFDSQGRILLPSSLITEAKIEKECVVVGVMDHVEIWAKERWLNYYSEASESFEEIAEKLTEFIA